MRVFVAGNRGMLAQDLMPRLAEEGFEISGGDLPELDIADEYIVSEAVSALSPDIIINCAAYTAVDKAESEPNIARRVNRFGAAVLARTCQSESIPLIHISTDYIFSGDKKTPYTEEDTPAPLNIYGLSKLEGENEIRSILENHSIIRTSWLFSAHGNNFVKTIIRLAMEKEELRIVEDQTGCPTWTGELAGAIVRVASEITDNHSARGTWHFCGKGETSWFGFAETIIDEASKYCRLKVSKLIPVSTEEYPLPAKRPPWSVLDWGKYISRFGVRPLDWQEGVKRVVEEIYMGNDEE